MTVCHEPALEEELKVSLPARSLIFSPYNVNRIRNDQGKKVFSVYLLHSLPLEMSAIQLFVGDKMAVVAHLVSKDTIGRIPNTGLDEDVITNYFFFIPPMK